MNALLPLLHNAVRDGDSKRAKEIAALILVKTDYPSTILDYCALILNGDNGKTNSARKVESVHSEIMENDVVINVDHVDASIANGWAWIKTRPDEHLCVEIFAGEHLLGQGIANNPREDLKVAGIGSGNYGFSISFRTNLAKNVSSLTVRAYPAGFLNVLATKEINRLVAKEYPSSLSPSDKLLLLSNDHFKYTSNGEFFEDGRQISRQPLPDDVLLFAFYLPQFHSLSINDKIWGKGFTEWRQLSRSISRFPGHYQPRTPRDLGFYDLSNDDILAKQIDLARTSGINAFCYYYYCFTGVRRVLDMPLDRHATSDDIDMPFLIMWANENWTKTWDGLSDDVFLKQEYLEKDEELLVDDLARYLSNPKYLRIGNRPLFIIYRPRLIPDTITTLNRWRQRFKDSHGLEPLIFMAQGFESYDPTEFGCDGAIEFPPHKLANKTRDKSVQPYFDSFQGRVIEYDEFVKASLAEEDTNFPLIKTICPSWDNDPRRPCNGLSVYNSSPFRYEHWLKALIQRSKQHLVYGRRIVAINAWNEWAESAYLEPDVYYGSAYLNATARALLHANAGKLADHSKSMCEVTVIMPCYNHEKFLRERLFSITSQTILPSEIIFLDDCSTDNSLTIAREILSKASIPYKIIPNSSNSGNVFQQWLKGLQIASYDVIWIAETDDSADCKFLEYAVPHFSSNHVRGVLGHISYISENGKNLPELDSYYQGLTFHTWNNQFSIAAAMAFAHDFSVCNVIPNASGFLFRKPLLTDSERKNLLEFKFSGDWLFYAYVLRGGSYVYEPRAKSYFRKVEQSASRGAFYSEMHKEEHKRVIRLLHSEYGISRSALEAHTRRLMPFVQGANFHDLFAYLNPPVAYRVLKICIIAHSFSVGGGEVVPLQLANHLRSLGHHVTYLLMERLNQDEPSIEQRLRKDIPVVYFDTILDDVEWFLNSYRFDLINSHNVGVEYHLSRLHVRVPCVWIASLHGGHETVPHILSPQFIEYVGKSVSSWLYLADKNINALVSAGLKSRNFIKSFNGVDARSIDWEDAGIIRDKYGVRPGQLAIVLCSRAIPEKGWIDAIRATQIVNSSQLKIHLFLIGAGPVLDSHGKDYANHDYIHFLGQVNMPIRMFKSFDFAVFPSTYSGETFPMFIVECLASGVPVIGTAVGEIPVILRADSSDSAAGIAIPVPDSSEDLHSLLAKEMLQLISDPSRLQLLQSNAKKLARVYSLEAQAAHLLEVYEQCSCKRS